MHRPDPRDRRARAAGDDPVEHYLSVLADKTGSLIATSGRFGAMLAGADEATVDVLDPLRRADRRRLPARRRPARRRSATAPTRARRPGTDLREGVPTLPVLLRAGARADPADARLLELLDGDLDRRRRRTPRRWRLLRAHPAMAAARAEVARWADEARVGPRRRCPTCPAKAALGRALRPGRRPHRLARPAGRRAAR